jgi:hypothetical protein
MGRLLEQQSVIEIHVDHSIVGRLEQVVPGDRQPIVKGLGLQAQPIIV